ncbi:MAG: glycosyltransferase N-terminal domain-containing protein [Acidobacteriota bacterium]
MWLLYQIAFGIVLVLAAPVLLLRKGSHYWATLSGRLGGFSDTTGGAIPRGALWMHAVSVGEAGVAATLARALPAVPLLLTTITPTGQARAKVVVAGLPPGSAATYLPFDFGFAVRRFFGRFAPAALVLVEGDLWPLVLRSAKRQGLPIVVVNGRLSDRGFARMRRLRPFLLPLLGRVDRFAVQGPVDRDRLVSLGVDSARITITGNLKYETPEPRIDEGLERRLMDLAAGRPVLLAGSTMPGEEEQVLDGFAALGGGARAMLVLAPRHPERFGAVSAMLESRSISFLRRSRVAAGAPAQAGSPPALVLLDSVGDLAGLYRIAAAAFVGGTLSPTGGHNPLEPARFAVPVAVGPSMFNFREMAEHFDRAHAWQRVRDGGELGRVWQGWLSDPLAARALGERGAALLLAHRGALARTIEFLQPVLAAVDAARPAEVS